MRPHRFWGLSALLASPSALPSAQATQAAKHAILQGSLQAGTWAKQTKEVFELDSLNTCDACMNLLSVLEALSEHNENPVDALMKKLCISTTHFNERYCERVGQKHVPELMYIARGVDPYSPTAKQFCFSLFGVCDPPEVREWRFPFPSLPFCDEKDEPKAIIPKKPKKPKKQKRPLRIVHFTDIHYDKEYWPGTSTTCDYPRCCRLAPWAPFEDSWNPPPRPWPENIQSPAGWNGEHNCGTPQGLELSMYNKIKEVLDRRHYRKQGWDGRGPMILFTGDISHQLISDISGSITTNYTDRFYGPRMKWLSEPYYWIFGTLGNHDAHSVNIFEPTQMGWSTRWLYNVTGTGLAQYLGWDVKRQMLKHGAYSTRVRGLNLRIISLNTNLYSRLNWALYLLNGARDPDGQLYWLAQELDKAEKAGQPVYIIGHMHFGHPDALPDQSNYFDQIVRRYASTIRGMFFGHTHMDEFAVSYSDPARRDADHAAAVSYIGPSLSPDAGMPAFRVYDVDPDTFAVRDFVTYIADMEDPAFQREEGPRWTRYYSAKEAYGWAASPPLGEEDGLTPAFWHNLTEAFERNATLFDEFVLRKTRGWIRDKCEGECKEKELCQLRAGRSQDGCSVRGEGIVWGFGEPFKVGNGSRGGGEKERRGVDSRACAETELPDVIGGLLSRGDLLEELQARFVAGNGTIRPWEEARPEVCERSTVVMPRGWNATGNCVDREATKEPFETAAGED